MSTTLSTANAQVNPPDATTLADDLVAGVHYPIVKLDVGAVGATSMVTATNPLPTSSKIDLTPAAAGSNTVGVASVQLAAANANRTGFYVNVLSNATVSLGFGGAAVINTGVTLQPFQSFWMDEFCFDKGTVNAIASAGGTSVSFQEFST